MSLPDLVTNPIESRPRDTNPGGKCTERLEVLVPPEIHDAIAALATFAGIGKSEYVRRLLEQHAFGTLHYTRSRIGS